MALLALRSLEDGRPARPRVKVHENYCLQSRRAGTPVLHLSF